MKKLFTILLISIVSVLGYAQELSFDNENRLYIPETSSSITIKFKTRSSIYKQTEKQELFTLFLDSNKPNKNNTNKIELAPVVNNNEAVYVDHNEANVEVYFCWWTQYLKLRMNNYGKDIFSIRVKYPVVDVNLDGTTIIKEEMPSELEGCYIKKDENYFTIHYADGSIIRQYKLADYQSVDAMLDVMQQDNQLTDVFEIKNLSDREYSFDEINNFDKINLTKYHKEIPFVQVGSQYYTGQEYWDSYPTLIQGTDIGTEHTLQFNIKVENGVPKLVETVFDGVWAHNEPPVINIRNPYIQVNLGENTVIREITGIEISDYKVRYAPIVCALHYIQEGESTNKTLHISSKRLHDYLAYFKDRGIKPISYDESIEIIQGKKEATGHTFHLCFDDRQKSHWTNKNVRAIFEKFDVKPTLPYIIEGVNMNDETPPWYALSQSEYKEMTDAGWRTITHGFTLHTDELSYAQFNEGFRRTKEVWKKWYDADLSAYVPHDNFPTIVQFHLLKYFGIQVVTPSSNPYGTYVKAGTTLNIPYGRCTVLDNEYAWDKIELWMHNWMRNDTKQSQYTLKIGESGWASMCLWMNTRIPEGIEAFYVKEGVKTDNSNNQYITLEPITTGIIPAQQGVIVRGETGEYPFVYTHEFAAEDSIKGNLLKGTPLSEYVKAETNKTYYVLGNIDGETGLYPAKTENGQFLNNENKVYLPIENAGINYQRIKFHIGEGTTSIEETTDKTGKCDVIFDLQGRRIQKVTEAGLYIKNNKKVYISEIKN